MEFLGSGGVLLIILGALWFSFMTPSGERTVRKQKTKRVKGSRQQKPVLRTPVAAKTPTTPVFIGQEADSQAVTAAEKVVINRLPDPLSARLGTIENVSWAQVHELEKVREEKENVSSENLDEILKRRRSNG
jgi:hypothetical protein